MKEIRFGDFDGNGTTDVFGVVTEKWQVSYSPRLLRGIFSQWQPLRSKLTESVDNVVVADFGGDGIADVLGFVDFCCASISDNGVQDWKVAFPSPFVAAIGRFRLGHHQADVLMWNICDQNSNGNTLCIVEGGTNLAKPYNTQEMR